jgi:HEAT repeat protein
VRQNALWALGRLKVPSSAGTIRKGLIDTDPLVRRDAASALGEMPAEDIRAAVADLVACCGMDDAEVRKAALPVLAGAVERQHARFAGELQPLLKDTDRQVRQLAAIVLGRLGTPEGDVAMPILADTLQTGDRQIRHQAVLALGKLGDPAGLPHIVKSLSDADTDMRRFAALALGNMGSRAEPAIPELLKMVTNRAENADVRVQAATALNAIGKGGAARDAVPALVRVLEDTGDDPKVRERIIWALRVHGVSALAELPGVVPALTKILGEPRRAGVKMLYFDSAYMLGMIEQAKAPDKALDVLLEFLRDDGILIYVGTKAPKLKGPENDADRRFRETGMGDGRLMAIHALARIGPRAAARADIVQELRAIAGNPRLWTKLRDEAREVLEKLK